MQTLTLSFSLPDAAHPHVQLRVSSNDADCDVVIELPLPASRASHVPDTPMTAQDEYLLGGYAGI